MEEFCPHGEQMLLGTAGGQGLLGWAANTRETNLEFFLG
jgi:hypothetical protein